MAEPKKISFDFDSTLSEEWVQALAGIIINSSEVWVTTSRNEGISHNKDLYKIAGKLGIPNERILFTNGGFKWSVLDANKIDIHFDDMEDEILEINKNSKCQGVLVGLKDTGELWYLFHQENKIN